MREKSIRNDNRQQERYLKEWIANLDPSRNMVENDHIKKNEQVGRFFVHPKSQATLTYSNALGVLSLFASTMVCTALLSQPTRLTSSP
jgi:hypothetical protein